MKNGKYLSIVILICVGFGFATADAQENLAQEAYAIFQQNCLICHGEHGPYTEELVIQSRQGLIDIGTVIPGNPEGSEFYQRLIETAVEKRMPLGQPPLSDAAIDTVQRWIQAGAPDWNAFARTDIDFITTQEMLQAIENHVQSLDTFDRAFARYFTSTHLYNAGEDLETLNAYQRALSKLVNSLSWRREVTKPQPIDSEATIFYIDLRDYKWELGTNRWTLIETEYPYKVAFDAPTQTHLHEKLTNLRQEMSCEVPFVHVDWFLATASLPPLYHDILDLPLTDSELEARLEVNVTENIINAAGKRVWRAGFNESGVSNHNRIVERHRSGYGAYWKSYDFAGSAGSKNILTHPLNFTHDGGEIIFNLPNKLQAYYLVDVGGNRLNEAPTEIVQNPATSDSTVRNGLSCIGCHTEGMKTFEDQVRGVAEQSEDPPFDKDRVLRLYVEKTVMDALVEEDTEHYRQALEATGDIFGGIEPVQRFHEAFQGPLDASHAAAAVGLETEVFLEKIRGSTSLQNLGLLVLENGTVKRDAWTSNFDNVISALNTPDSVLPPVVQRPELIPGTSVYIPDLALRDVIVNVLDLPIDASITAADMEKITGLGWDKTPNKGIQDLTGLEYAVNLDHLILAGNQISDLSPITTGFKNLRHLALQGNPISDLSPLSKLTTLERLELNANLVSDLSPLTGLTNLKQLLLWRANPIDFSILANLKHLEELSMWHGTVSNLSAIESLKNLEHLEIYDHQLEDISPIAALTGLRSLQLGGNRNITDASPASKLTNLEYLDFHHDSISDLSPLAGLTNLKYLNLYDNRLISDLSPLGNLTGLTFLHLHRNMISDVSPLARLINLEELVLRDNLILDISSLEGLSVFSDINWVENPGSAIGGPMIEGPWVWIVVPAEHLDKDWLATADSGGVNGVTEQKIATFGARPGSTIGDEVWTVSKIGHRSRNISDMVESIGEEKKSNRAVYGSIILESPSEQKTVMLQGSNGLVKIWINGELVHKDTSKKGWPYNYEKFFPVTLKQGANVLLVAIQSEYTDLSGFFGFEEGVEYTVIPSRSSVGYAFSENTIHVGDTFTLDLSAENVIHLAGWQFDIAFDPAVLEAVEVNESDFLKTGGGTTFFQKGTIDNATGKITKLSSARLNEDGVNGTGTLLSVTFTAKAGGETRLSLDNFQLGSITGGIINAGPHEVVFTIEGQLAIGDVNRDGQISVLDLIFVARHLGEDAAANPQADVNRDGVINIQDLLLVAQHLGESTDAAAPSVIAAINNGELTPAMVQAWITQAQIEDDGSITFQQGIATLERLLTLFIPEETALLHNYPNPFNPETWIPYQLSEPAEVTLTIHSVNGTLVRTLALGYQPAGIYQTRTRAAYWDGKNQVGEPVASGIYFYTLTAGDFNATRKMLIRK